MEDNMIFDRMGVKSRLFTGFGLILFLMIFLGVISIYYMKSLADKTTQLYQYPYAVSTAALQVETEILRIHRGMLNITLSKNQEDIDRLVLAVNEAEKNVYSEFKVLYERFLGKQKEVQSLEQLIKDWKPIRDEVIFSMATGYLEDAAELTKNQGAAHVSKINKALHDFETLAAAEADKFFANAQEERDRSLMLTYILIAAAVILVVLLAFLVSVSITRPLGAIVDYAGKVADGDLGAQFEGSFRAEFGEARDYITKMVASLKHGQEEVEKNVAELNQVLSQVAVAADQVTSGSSQVSDSSQALSQGATEQAASLEEITSSMTELGSQT